MTNQYYVATGTPATGASGLSSPIRSEFAAIQAAFALLPDFTTAPANALMAVNATNTGWTTVAGLTFANGAITSLKTAGNISAAAWTTAGLRESLTAATLTDTSSSGTVATVYADAHKAATFAASSATTYTNAFGAYFEAPVAGGNVTLTNKWALGADSLKVSGACVLNGLTLTASTGTLTIASGKTVTINNTITWSGTDSTTMTLPSTSATIARTDAGQTFTGAQTITGKLSETGGQITVSGNVSAAAWTTSGLRFVLGAATLTDTSSAGTVAAVYADVHGSATLAASSATTYTDTYGCFFVTPGAGTNVTLSNAWAIGAQSMNVSGVAKLNGLTIGTSTGTFSIGNSLNIGFLTSGQHMLTDAGSNVLGWDTGGAAFYLPNSTATTASAANVFMDNANSNKFSRSTSSIRYKLLLGYLSNTNPGTGTAAQIASASIAPTAAITTPTTAGDFIDGLRPVAYTSLSPSDDPARIWHGFIAEEVAQLHPGFVTWMPVAQLNLTQAPPQGYADWSSYVTANGKNINGVPSVPDWVQYPLLTVPLTIGLQAVRSRIAVLTAQVQSLTSRLAAAGIP
jgi:hypothetical protein